jgi:acyl-coenzyme A thioesterase PaaI-like protein
LDDPDFTYYPMISRLVKPTTEDAFFAETIKSSSTISHVLSLYQTPSGPREPVNEVRTLMHLGPHLNGWPNVVHGGIQSFILDEIMAFMCGLNPRISPQGPIRETTVTGELKVRFIKLVKSPIVVLVNAKLKDVRGRKCWTEATLAGEDGVVLASAEGLFIMLDPQRHKF